MTTLHFRHEFKCGTEDLWRVLYDPEFDERLTSESGVTRVTTEDETRDGIRYMKRDIITDKEVPGPLRKAAGMDYLKYIQVSELDLENGELKWEVMPHSPKIAKRVHIVGYTRVYETDEGSEREVTGTIKITIPLVGGTMERLIASGVVESYDESAQIARDIIEARGL